ncbi:MAG: hypothetical protein ACFFCS_07835 [Candidatus Hodarchaeota archaeon]
MQVGKVKGRRVKRTGEKGIFRAGECYFSTLKFNYSNYFSKSREFKFIPSFNLDKLVEEAIKNEFRARYTFNFKISDVEHEQLHHKDQERERWKNVERVLKGQPWKKDKEEEKPGLDLEGQVLKDVDMFGCLTVHGNSLQAVTEHVKYMKGVMATIWQVRVKEERHRFNAKQQLGFGMVTTRVEKMPSTFFYKLVEKDKKPEYLEPNNKADGENKKKKGFLDTWNCEPGNDDKKKHLDTENIGTETTNQEPEEKRDKSFNESW